MASATTNDPYRRYADLLLEYHRLLVAGGDASAETAAVEEEMTGLWDGFTDVQRRELSGLSSDLNWLRRKGEPAPQGRRPDAVTSDDMQALEEAQEAGNWQGLLHQIRVCAPKLPLSQLAQLRALAWDRAVFPEVAHYFRSFAEELAPSYVVPRDQDAYPTIRGFVYQVDRTIERWLTLREGQELELERGEDIDVVTRLFIAGQEDVIRLLEQVKHRTNNVTLRDSAALHAIACAVEHRLANPEIDLLFRYTTNADVGRESSVPDAAKTPYIALWEHVRLGDIPTQDVNGALQTLHDFLAGLPKPDSIPKDRWESLQEFLRTSEDAWADFVRRFEWGTGAPAAIKMGGRIRQILTERGWTNSDAHAEQIYQRLFLHVFKLLSQAGIKRLTIGELRQQISLPTLSESDHLLLQTVVGRLGPLEHRMSSVETTLGQLTATVDVLTTPAVQAFLPTSEFFRGLLDRRRLFHHGFEHIGQARPLALLSNFAKPGPFRIALLPGRGGIGKTRLLLAFARGAEQNDPNVAVRFLVENVPLTNQALHEIPKKPCIIVVDDAHRCQQIGVLLAYSQQRPDVKIVLATRPHGLDRLRVEVTRAGFDANEVTAFPAMRALAPEDIRELARAALGKWSDRSDVVDRLAQVTRDCPLATVIGGRLLEENAVAPELLAHDDAFRHEVFNRFRDERLGQLGPEIPVELARRVLQVLAAVNPIRADGNEPLIQQIASQVQSDSVQVATLIGELEAIELLSRRGNLLRLTPDVLADHILETACLTPQNRPTGFAEAIFDRFRQTCAGNVLRNLSELDWRIRSASRAEGRLLDRLWAAIETTFQDGTFKTRSEILSLVSDVAHFQPRQVLNLAQMAASLPVPESREVEWLGDFPIRPPDLRDQLPRLLRHCVYTTSTLGGALDLLWNLGIGGVASSENNSDNPFRVIGEVAKFEYFGLWWIAEGIAQRVRAWSRLPDGARFRTELLGIIEPLLAKTGGAAWSEGDTVRLESFHIPYREVQKARRTSFATLQEMLDLDDVSVQLRCLALLEGALNGPMPVGRLAVTDEVLADWEPDQLEILDLLNQFLVIARPDVVRLRVFEAVRFQATHGRRPSVRARAREIRAKVGDSFDVRLTRVLIPRLCHWDDFDEDTPENQARVDPFLRQQQYVELVAQDVWGRYSTARAAFDYLDAVMRSLRELEPDANPDSLVWQLMRCRPDHADPFAECLLSADRSPLAASLSTCLNFIRTQNPAQATARAALAAESANSVIVRSAAHFYSWGWPTDASPGDLDVEIVTRLLAHPDGMVRRVTLGALYHVARNNMELARTLALSVDIADDSAVAEELARLTEPSQREHLPGFGDDDIRKLLRKLDSVDRLRHWTSELLRRVGQRMPEDVVDLFLRRLTHQEQIGYRVHYDIFPEHGIDGIFGGMESPRHGVLIRRTRDEAIAGGHWRWATIPQLFRAVSGNFGAEGIAALQEWLDSREPDRVIAVARLLGAALPRSLFEQYQFIERVLNAAETAGEECFDRVYHTLLAVAAGIERHGIAGQPYPQDVDQRDRATAILEKLSPGTKAFRFFEEIRRSSENRINAEITRDDDMET